MPIEFEFIDKGLAAALQNLPVNVQNAVVKTVAETTDRAREIVRFKTPVDSQKLFNGWRTRSEEQGLRGVFFNNVAYAAVLEFGGYPVRKRTATASPGTLIRGKAVLGGLPPGVRTQRATGFFSTLFGAQTMRSNVSKQAPQGMVRSTLIEIEPQFVFDLAENIDRSLVA